MRDICRDPREGDIVVAGLVTRMVTYRSSSGAHQVLYMETRSGGRQRNGGCYLKAWHAWCKARRAKPLQGNLQKATTI